MHYLARQEASHVSPYKCGWHIICTFSQMPCEGKKKRIVLKAPASQKDYVTYFSAVDRNDQDSSDYSTSIRTNHWYLRLVFWALDCVLHVVCVIAIFCANAKIGPKKWRQSRDKNGGHMKLQIDLGIELSTFAIELERADSTITRPGWLHQTSFIPCDCKKCFFCLNKLTNGIHHCPETIVVIHHSDGSKTKTPTCTSTAVRIMKNSSYCRICY